MIKMRLILALLFFLLGNFAVSCRKDLSKYYIRKSGLDHLPIAMDEFISLTPLGYVSPPGHVFPNDHMGFYYVKEVKPVTIYAPGDLHLTEIRSNTYSPGTPDAVSDYALTFGVNGESALILGHISELSPKLLQAFGNGGKCEEYSAGTGMLKACRKEVSLPVQSGEVLGYSNLLPAQLALDMGMYVNNKAVSPLDYFTDELKAQLESRLMGSPNAEYDGVLRIDEPLAGEVYQDIPGALQGVWYKKGAPKLPESPHIAFIKNYIKPAELRISFGKSVPLFGPGLWKFNQQHTGQIDRAFAAVKADGSIYCYDPLYLSYDPDFPAQGTFPNNSFLVKLENAKTLSLEKRDCNCSEQLPYAFTANKLTFVRY